MGRTWDLSCILIQNRNENSGVEKRLFPFYVEISENDKDFRKIMYVEGYSHPEEKKIVCQFTQSLKARFVRLVLLGENRILSINQVKIYAKNVNE